MDVDGQPLYTFFLKMQSESPADTFPEDLASLIAGNWSCDHEAASSFSPDTRKALTLSISGQAATLFFEGTPLYAFQWEVRDVIPWDAVSYTPGYTVLLSVPYREEPLLLEDIPFSLDCIELDLEENQDPSAGFGFSLCLSVDGAAEYLHLQPSN